MCLSIPSKIKSIDLEMNTCVVDTMGVERGASLDLIDQDVVVGDYVLIHIAYIGVFGQQCRSSTGHFCNEIF